MVGPSTQVWYTTPVLMFNWRKLDFMRTNELMLSDHEDIIDVIAIQGDKRNSCSPTADADCFFFLFQDMSPIVYFDDREADLGCISRQDQFFRWSFSVQGGSAKVWLKNKQKKNKQIVTYQYFDCLGRAQELPSG